MNLKNQIRYFSDTIFRQGDHAFSTRRALWGARFWRVLYRTVTGLTDHNTVALSAALTLYTLISIVPIVALLFAVLQAFGMVDGLVEQLYAAMPQNPEVVDYVVDFAHRTLAHTRSGVIAVVAVATLLWAVIRVFGAVETAFNEIWEVEKARNIFRQWGIYLLVVVVVPLLWISASWVGSFALETLHLDGTWFGGAMTKAISLTLVWGMFFLIYIGVPNTRVRWRSALTAAVVAGVFFALFQWGYVYLQRWMSSYNAIYGSFAALPLFLLWLQTAWQILLIGGELSRAVQLGRG